MNNNTRRREFKFLGQPIKGGQRFFKAIYSSVQDGRLVVEDIHGIYVADHSGKTPDHTSDGPLRLIEEDGLTIYEDGTGRIRVEIGVLVENTEKAARVDLMPREAEWLRQQTAPTMRVKLAIDSAEELNSLARLFSAWAASR